MHKEATVEYAAEIGLDKKGFELIKKILGRTPNYSEVVAYSINWSEAKNYENAKIWVNYLEKVNDDSLNKITHTGTDFIDIGDGLACAFKFDSKNQLKKFNEEVNSLGVKSVEQINSFFAGVIEKSNELISESLNPVITVTDVEIDKVDLKKASLLNNEIKEFDIESIVQPDSLKTVAFSLLQNSNIPLYKFGENKLTELRMVNVEGSNKALIMSTNSDTKYLKVDSEIGAMIAVSKVASSISYSGAKIGAMTKTLDLVSLSEPRSLALYKGSVKGFSIASAKFSVPLNAGNINLNDASTKDIKTNAPISTVGMIGVLDDKDKIMTPDFKEKGDLIFILGKSYDDISSSEYLSSFHGISESPAPYFNLEDSFDLQQKVTELIENNRINSVHDISEGGLYTSLLEMSIPNGLGFDIVTDSEVREDAFLFGEGQGRAVVSVNEDQEDDFIETMMASKVDFTLLGHVTQGKLMVDDEHFGFVNEVSSLIKEALAKH